MAYVIQKRKTKSGSTYWRVQWRKYKGTVATFTHIPESEYGPIGFSKKMTLDQAKAHCKYINQKEEIVRLAERRHEISKILETKLVVDRALLPEILVQEFENDVIRGDLGGGDDEKLKYNSTPSHWRLAQQIISHLKLDPTDWYDRKKAIYGEFKRRSMSPSYVEKVLRLMNQWGYFYCKRLKKAWEKIPRPRNDDLEAIRDKYIDDGGSETESDPFTLEHLKLAKQNLTKPQQADWLHVCLWFGLRPVECDALKNPPIPFESISRNKAGSWAIHNDGKVDVLWIFQSKLKGLERKKRWKGIPIVEPEQKEALKIILAIQIKLKNDTDYVWRRPLTKSIKAAVKSEGITAYGPRKNFFNIMKKRGYRRDDISMWLGHRPGSKITRDHYEDLTVVSYQKDAA